MMKKFVATLIVASVFLVMLSTSMFSLGSWQLSQITKKYELDVTSPKVQLGSYFKKSFRTKVAFSTLFSYNREEKENLARTREAIRREEDEREKTEKEIKEIQKRRENEDKEIAKENKIQTFCQDVLVDKTNLDACLLAISLFNTNNLNDDLSYNPMAIKELDLDGKYSRIEWSSISSWLKDIINTFKNLVKVSVWNYAGNQLFPITTNLNTFIVKNNKQKLDKDTFTHLPRTIKKLAYVNSQLTNIEEIDLNRFTNLEYLDISRNKLTTLSYPTGDFGVGKIISLKMLDASKNQITDIKGLFKINVQPNRFLEINLSKNKIKASNFGNNYLKLKNSRVNIDFSNNEIVDANKIFNSFKLDDSLSNDFKLLGEVNLSFNRINTLPNKVAEISHTVKLYGNKLKNFSPLINDAKLSTLLLRPSDLQKDIWKGDIYTDGKVASIKPIYMKWFLAKGKSDNSPLKLSVLQEAYIDKVLLPTAVKLYMINVTVENPKAKIATLEDLESKVLGDAALDVNSVKKELKAPTTPSEFYVMISLATNGINQEVVQSYTNYVNYLRILENTHSNTNTFLPKTTLIIIIALSIVGVLIAAGFIGTYFFKGSKSKKGKGDF